MYPAAHGPNRQLHRRHMVGPCRPRTYPSPDSCDSQAKMLVVDCTYPVPGSGSLAGMGVSSPELDSRASMPEAVPPSCLDTLPNQSCRETDTYMAVHPAPSLDVLSTASLVSLTDLSSAFSALAITYLHPSPPQRQTDLPRLITQASDSVLISPRPNPSSTVLLYHPSLF